MDSFKHKNKILSFASSDAITFGYIKLNNKKHFVYSNPMETADDIIEDINTMYKYINDSNNPFYKLKKILSVYSHFTSPSGRIWYKSKVIAFDAYDDLTIKDIYKVFNDFKKYADYNINMSGFVIKTIDNKFVNIDEYASLKLNNNNDFKILDKIKKIKQRWHTSTNKTKLQRELNYLVSQLTNKKLYTKYKRKIQTGGYETEAEYNYYRKTSEEVKMRKHTRLLKEIRNLKRMSRSNKFESSNQLRNLTDKFKLTLWIDDEKLRLECLLIDFITMVDEEFNRNGDIDMSRFKSLNIRYNGDVAAKIIIKFSGGTKIIQARGYREDIAFMDENNKRVDADALDIWDVYDYVTVYDDDDTF